MPPSPFSATTIALTKADANSKLRAFRQIVQSRASARRFEPDCSVPDDIWRDVLRMTMVSCPSTEIGNSSKNISVVVASSSCVVCPSVMCAFG